MLGSPSGRSQAPRERLDSIADRVPHVRGIIEQLLELTDRALLALQVVRFELDDEIRPRSLEESDSPAERSQLGAFDVELHEVTRFGMFAAISSIVVTSTSISVPAAVCSGANEV